MEYYVKGKFGGNMTLYHDDKEIGSLSLNANAQVEGFVKSVKFNFEPRGMFWWYKVYFIENGVVTHFFKRKWYSLISSKGVKLVSGKVFLEGQLLTRIVPDNSSGLLKSELSARKFKFDLDDDKYLPLVFSYVAADLVLN